MLTMRTLDGGSYNSEHLREDTQCDCRYVGALMMEIAYGHEVTSLDDEIVVLAEKAVGATTEAGSPAATLIDFLPFCAYNTSIV